MTNALTPWRLVLLTLGIACIGIAPTFWLLWPKWMHSYSYSHGLLIVPLAGWLLWGNKDRISAELVKAVWWAAPILVGLLFVWLISFAANIEIGATATMPLILLAAVLMTAGWRIAMLSAFPLLLLYSAIPLWDYVNGILQSLTTKAVTVILAAINVPAFIQGNSVQIPSGWFEIAGGCSGLHFLIVGLTLSAVYSYLYLRTLRHKVAFVLIAVVMSIAMNWFRVATIITAGHLTNMQSYLVQVDHYKFGWFLFALMLVPFFMIARWLEHAGGADEPDTFVATTLESADVNRVYVALACIIVLSPALVWGRLVQNGPDPVSVELPEIRGWQGPAAFTGDWAPHFGGVDGETLKTYQSPEGEIHVYANWYRSQSQGRELIGSGSSVTGPSLHKIAESDYVDTAAANASKLPEIREIISNSRDDERFVIWYNFVVGGHAESSQLEAQLKQALYTVVGKRGTGLVAISMQCEQLDCADARDVLQQHYSNFEKMISNSLVDLDSTHE